MPRMRTRGMDRPRRGLDRFVSDQISPNGPWREEGMARRPSPPRRCGIRSDQCLWWCLRCLRWWPPLSSLEPALPPLPPLDEASLAAPDSLEALPPRATPPSASPEVAGPAVESPPLEDEA